MELGVVFILIIRVGMNQHPVKRVDITVRRKAFKYRYRTTENEETQRVLGAIKKKAQWPHGLKLRSRMPEYVKKDASTFSPSRVTRVV